MTISAETTHLLRVRQEKDYVATLRAIEAVVEVKARDSIPTLLKLLTARDQGIREWAISALVALSEPTDNDIAQAIYARVKDRAHLVRAALAEEIGNLGRKDGIPALFILLRDKGYLVRTCAAESLGMIGTGYENAIIPLLANTLQDEYTLVRAYAASAIGQLPHSDSLPLLYEQLQKEKYLYARTHILNALITLGEHHLIESLIGVLIPDYDASVIFSIMQGYLRNIINDDNYAFIVNLLDQQAEKYPELASDIEFLKSLTIAAHQQNKEGEPNN